MYKTASNKLNHIGRTGSASTRGAANGRLDAPWSATESEQHFNSMKERFDLISTLLADTRMRVSELREALNEGRHSPSEAKRLRHQLEEQFALLRDVERERAKYGNLARVAALDAFGATFFEIARLKMDPALFKALTHETRMMLGRRPGAGIVVPPNVPEIHEILADKAVALTAREALKYRDVWDVWYLQNMLNASVDREMVQKKFADYGSTETEQKAEKRVAELSKDATANAFLAEMKRFLPVKRINQISEAGLHHSILDESSDLLRRAVLPAAVPKP
ncbi:nucleotidyl transferase AbiEii/AbiGii toxin family protein [Bradyrhizobium sp. sGM-13]|uniref:nucleotidyl transferase AbiEii/AbiGii toxin family protein n=1 Tax=Bradyrhizobium sp. sGM-13 TaxID=2831781 RepID=UPI001BCD296B|nr:nucleotidyl transferase AbiEii/AbiGii toxin family protein [Bradyrhizobium sp. sGM-13]